MAIISLFCHQQSNLGFRIDSKPNITADIHKKQGHFDIMTLLAFAIKSFPVEFFLHAKLHLC